LELENIALKAQLTLNEKQLGIHQQVMEHLVQPKPEVVAALSIKKPFSFMIEPMGETPLRTIDVGVPLPSANRPLTPGLEGLPDRWAALCATRRDRTPSLVETTAIVRKKFEDAQMLQVDGRQPLAPRPGGANAPVDRKLSVRFLIDQLSERVAATLVNQKALR
jgi:hypothetical protein